MLKKKILNSFLKNLQKIHYGSIEVQTPDGTRHLFEGKTQPTPKVDLIIKKSSVITNLIAKGDIGFAESYRDGEFQTSNLTELLILALKNEAVLKDYFYGGFCSSIAAQIIYYLNNNSLKGSQRNIHAHYDLGNDFYSLWLDPTMSYSAALFKKKGDSLKQAQLHKYDRILERLEKKSGSLLEIGCGWGGFAERALENGDYKIKGITISNEQHEYATKRLDKHVNIALEDYRNQQGKYDNIVSIEMFEAVGEQYWSVYFKQIKSLLHNKGKAVVQTITLDESHFEKYRKTGDMIRSFIFPGGMLPSVSQFRQHIENTNLQMRNLFSFGQDYAKTLVHWLKAFEDNLENIRKLGFDEKFIRLWRFYLSTCIASFSTGRTNVIQAEIAHA